jgi:hypothetical protein
MEAVKLSTSLLVASRNRPCHSFPAIFTPALLFSLFASLAGLADLSLDIHRKYSYRKTGLTGEPAKPVCA